eukprot:scaffold84031_cov19-Prasinocladus_malaysianus.AAC.1
MQSELGNSREKSKQIPTSTSICRLRCAYYELVVVVPSREPAISLLLSGIHAGRLPFDSLSSIRESAASR